MTTGETIPTTAELWALLRKQAAEVEELKAANERMQAELERQRLEKLSLASRLAEVEGGHIRRDKKLSRAGVLKAAAAGAAGLIGAEMLGGGVAHAGMVTPGGTYDGDVIAGGATYVPSATNIYAANGVSGFGSTQALGVGPAPAGSGVNELLSSRTVDGIHGVGNAGGVGVAGYGGNSGGHGVLGVPGTGGVGGYFRADRANLHLFPASSPGAPPSGQHSAGDIYNDSTSTLYLCVTTGTPGTWVPLMYGNSTDGTHDTLFTAASTQQYTLSNSNGVTWVDMDAINLLITVTPQQDVLAIVSGNSDLWTSQAGYNQDLGITVSGGFYPSTAGQPEAWKESGGFAGTFSPNAAFVQTVVPLLAGTAYTIKLQWKANKSAQGATIWAGAGPINGHFSPTRLLVLLVPTP